MSFEALGWAIVAGALFSGAVSGVYWWFRRRDPRVRSQTAIVFTLVFFIITVRQYFIGAP